MVVLTAERIDVIECLVPGERIELAAPSRADAVRDVPGGCSSRRPGRMQFETSRALDHIDAVLPVDYDLNDEEPADEDVVEAEAAWPKRRSVRPPAAPGKPCTG